MAMQITNPVSAIKGAKETVAVGSLSDFVALAETVPASGSWGKSHCSGGSWYNGRTYSQALDYARDGDLSGVAASDEYLTKLESLVPMTHKWQNRLDVVGGAPCVPAFLAGQPMNMRRRERVASEFAPMALFADLTISGACSTDTLRKRGTAILALVRMLTAVRPVELYVTVGIGLAGHAAYSIIRLDTAPLDLAHAAHVLTCASFVRGLGYLTNCTMIAKQGGNWNGGWAYNDAEKQRTQSERIFKAATGCQEALVIPAAHVDDKCIKQPVDWLTEMVAKYAGASE